MGLFPNSLPEELSCGPPTTAKNCSVLNKIVVLERCFLEACRNWDIGRLNATVSQISTFAGTFLVDFAKGVAKMLVSMVGDTKVEV